MKQQLTSEEILRIGKSLIGKFEIPTSNKKHKHFPSFLSTSLNDFVSFFKTNLNEEIESKTNWKDGISNVLLPRIEGLTKGILDSVNLYYDGEVHEATKNFFETLDRYFIPHNQTIVKIDKEFILYRARIGELKNPTKANIFHVPFEQRHKISTKRYSISGFPALYLCGSTYVCWEEFDRQDFRKMWVSGFKSNKELSVIKLQKVDDFITDLTERDLPFMHMNLMRYLITFPLTIACSIKTEHMDAHFKPEYIIPQLLLQYVKSKSTIDGIMYPSTKIDYTNYIKVDVYNYIFPVKSTKETGHCNSLKSTFSLTNPTTLENEELLTDPAYYHAMNYNEDELASPILEVSKGHGNVYVLTAFGKLEKIIKEKTFKKL